MAIPFPLGGRPIAGIYRIIGTPFNYCDESTENEPFDAKKHVNYWYFRVGDHPNTVSDEVITLSGLFLGL